MITEIKKLIQHTFDCNELLSHISPNCIKDIEMEWNKEENKKSPFAIEISDNDLVLSIEDINPPHEVFAYFFFKVKESNLGNTAYTLTKAIFDSELSDDFIKYCISAVLKCVMNGNDLINDRVIVKGNYPLTLYQFAETEQQVITELFDDLNLKRGNIIPNDKFEVFSTRQ